MLSAPALTLDNLKSLAMFGQRQRQDLKIHPVDDQRDEHADDDEESGAIERLGGVHAGAT